MCGAYSVRPMPTEDAIRDELVSLLRYANKTAVAEALRVSTQAVINWSEGKHPSQARLDQIRELYGLPVAPQGTTKDPRPEWAGEMESRIVSEVQANRAALMEALAAAFAEWAARELDEDNDDEGLGGTSDRPSTGAGPKPRPAT